MRLRNCSSTGVGSRKGSLKEGNQLMPLIQRRPAGRIAVMTRAAREVDWPLRTSNMEFILSILQVKSFDCGQEGIATQVPRQQDESENEERECGYCM